MSEKNTLEEMLKQYEKNSFNSQNSNKSKTYDLKNYFNTHIPDKAKQGTKKIRILPTQDGSSPFKELYGHKAQVEGEWKTFVCLKHERNEDCPFCEAREALLATGKDSDREFSKKYSAKKMYVVKVIDREKEEEGVKFWRFNHDYRKQGILDKIYGVLQAVGKDITDKNTGRDLLISIARDQNNRPAIQSISHMDPTPLSTDEETSAEWLSDDRTWEDVYAIKPYDYLEIIVKGGVPVMDKNTKKYVDKASVVTESDDMQEEISLGVSNVKPTVTPAQKTVKKEAIISAQETEETDNSEDDDLPF